MGLEKLIDKGDGNYDTKERQKNSLREVISFCENKVDCRRSLVLSVALCNQSISESHLIGHNASKHAITAKQI